MYITTSVHHVKVFSWIVFQVLPNGPIPSDTFRHALTNTVSFSISLHSINIFLYFYCLSIPTRI